MQPEIKFSPNQVKNFFASRVWAAIEQDARAYLEKSQFVLENVNANIEQIRFAQGKLDTLRWVLGIPEQYAGVADFDAKQDGDLEDES